MGSLGWAKQVPGVDNDKDALPTWSHHMFLQLFIPKLKKFTLPTFVLYR